jgi:glycosyltransferase involved in cell wall biosynthesis
MMFSVVVPTYNRLPLLRKTLESLFCQDMGEREIIVVDDGSSDGTEQYCRELSAEKKIRYILQQNRGPAIARNTGIRASSGEYIAFTDDDCIVPKDWLSRYAAKFRETGAAVIGGIALTGNPGNPFADANDLIVNFLKSAVNPGSVGLVPFLTTNNSVYRRSILERTGGFDTRFTIGAEERELNHRCGVAGALMLFDPGIVVEHYNDADLPRFVQHQYHQGQGSFLYYTIARDGQGERPEAIPLNAYIGLLFEPFRVRPFGRAALLAILIILAQCSVAAGFFAAMIRKPARKGEPV